MAVAKQRYNFANELEAPPSYESLHLSSTTSSYSPRSSLEARSVPSSFKPIVVPQTSKSFKGAFFSPFSCAYCHDLRQHSITPSEFLFFIDGLNEAFIAHPAFQMASYLGTIMSFVPVFPVAMAGIGLSLGSGFVSAGTSWARAKSYVKTANEEIFLPRGLRCTVLKTRKMMLAVGHGADMLELTPLDVRDRGHESACGSNDPRMRRIRALGGRVAPLTFEGLPDPEPMDNWWKKMGSTEAQKKDAKMHKKLMKERRKGFEEYEKSTRDVDKESNKYDKELQKIGREKAKEVTKAERRLCKTKGQDPKERAKIEKGLFKELAKSDKEMNKTLKKKEKEVGKERMEGSTISQKADKKEQRIAQKIYWIVIDKADGLGQDGEMDDMNDEETEEEHGEPAYDLSGRDIRAASSH